MPNPKKHQYDTSTNRFLKLQKHVHLFAPNSNTSYDELNDWFVSWMEQSTSVFDLNGIINVDVSPTMCCVLRDNYSLYSKYQLDLSSKILIKTLSTETIDTFKQHNAFYSQNLNKHLFSNELVKYPQLFKHYVQTNPEKSAQFLGCYPFAVSPDLLNHFPSEYNFLTTFITHCRFFDRKQESYDYLMALDKKDCQRLAPYFANNSYIQNNRQDYTQERLHIFALKCNHFKLPHFIDIRISENLLFNYSIANTHKKHNEFIALLPNSLIEELYEEKTVNFFDKMRPTETASDKINTYSTFLQALQHNKKMDAIKQKKCVVSCDYTPENLFKIAKDPALPMCLDALRAIDYSTAFVLEKLIEFSRKQPLTPSLTPLVNRQTCSFAHLNLLDNELKICWEKSRLLQAIEKERGNKQYKERLGKRKI